jgi:sarcosine oxidase subunit gamma
MPERTHPAASLLVSGRHGAPGPDPVRLAAPLRDIVQVAARRDGAAALAEAVRTAFGLDLPPAGHTAVAGDVAALWVQPQTWMLVAPAGDEGELARRLKAACGDAASVVDQSHGRCVLRIEGAQAASVLARICRVDVHPRAFGPGRVASTPVGDLPCVLHQTDAEPSFEMIVFSTYIESFLDALTEAAAAVGYVSD